MKTTNLIQSLIISFFLLLIPAFQAYAEIETSIVKYEAGGVPLQGYLAYDSGLSEKRPGILIVHEWWGHNDYARKRAEMLAELGYVAFAVDMYGDGKTASHPSEAGQFADAVMKDLELARERFEAALELLRAHKNVQAEDIAAIGYCFGGGIVLHMARMGLDIDGVVSFHGSLKTEMPADAGKVKASVLVFNGADDAMVTAEDIDAFHREMTEAGVDYEFVSYPQVKHSFTNPEADLFAEKYNLPLAYDKDADQQSWAQMQSFFKEIFQD